MAANSPNLWAILDLPCKSSEILSSTACNHTHTYPSYFLQWLPHKVCLIITHIYQCCEPSSKVGTVTLANMQYTKVVITKNLVHLSSYMSCIIDALLPSNGHVPMNMLHFHPQVSVSNVNIATSSSEKPQNRRAKLEIIALPVMLSYQLWVH